MSDVTEEELFSEANENYKSAFAEANAAVGRKDLPQMIRALANLADSVACLRVIDHIYCGGANSERVSKSEKVTKMMIDGIASLAAKK